MSPSPPALRETHGLIELDLTVHDGPLIGRDLHRRAPPEGARVYVIVPGVKEVTRIHVGSPRLAQPQRAADFTMEVTEEPHDAGSR